MEAAARFIRRDWAVCHCDVVKHVGETRRYRNAIIIFVLLEIYICIVRNSTLIWLLTMFYI